MFNSTTTRAALLALISFSVAAPALAQNFLTDIPGRQSRHGQRP